MMVAGSVEEQLQDEIEAALRETSGFDARVTDPVARFAVAVEQAIAGFHAHVNNLSVGIGRRKSSRHRQGRRPARRH